MDEIQAESWSEQADRARARGDLDAAVALYEQLESAQPDRPEWPLRRAEVLYRLGDRIGECAALARSGELYAEAGRAVEAVAVCRLARSIDPAHRVTRDRLAALAAECRAAEAAWPAPVDASALSDPQARVAPLEAVRLASLFRDAEPVQWTDRDEPAFRIRLDGDCGSDDPDGSVEGTLVEETDADGDSPVEIGALDLDDPAASAFRATPLFGELDGPALERLIEIARVVEIANGEVFHRQGDAAPGLYAVAHGAVVPFVEITSEGGGPPFRHAWRALRAGEFFGEAALLNRAPQRVSLQARGDTRLLLLPQGAMARWIEEDPFRSLAVLGLVRRRLVDRLIETHPLLSPFAGEPRDTLARSFRLVEVEDGTAIIEQGRPAHAVFAVMSGRLSVTRADEEGEKVLAELEAGELCGERSVVMGAAADASVVSCGRAWLLEWPAEELRSRLDRAPDSTASPGPVPAATVAEPAPERARPAGTLREGT